MGSGMAPDGMMLTDPPALLKGIRFFTRETEILSDLSVVCGSGDRLAAAMDGETVRESTVFDLASITKLFTGLCLLRLHEAGELDPARSVAFYDPRFVHLRGASVAEVMTFALSLQTPGRIDACPGRESGLRCLFETVSAGPPGPRAYSDIPAMVLKYVIEAVSGMPLMDCIRKLILQPADMTETWSRVPADRLADTMDYSGEYRLERGVVRFRKDLPRGVPHDPKAALLQGESGDLCGHAGLFSTRDDLVRFCRAVLAGKIVSPASLEQMAVNRTGRPLEGGGYSQYLGVLCYVRHPVQYYSEIPVYMGSRAFGLGGFTGNHLSVDPERNLFTVFLGNRVRNRLTVLLPEEGRTLESYGLRADGVGSVLREDGVRVPSSVHYVHQKDAHLHTAVSAVLDLPEAPFTPALPVSWR